MGTELDTTVLEGLDFEFVQPCEHSNHESLHKDEPAMFLVSRVRHCHRKDDYFVCLSGWERMGLAKVLVCTICSKHLGHRDEVLKIIKVLGT